MKILFVCTGNSFRSPSAEALLKQLCPDVEVESAGTDPTDHIASNAKQLLRKVGAERYVKRKPDSVESKEVEEYQLIVAMKNEHREYIMRRWPEVADRIQVWDIDDPIYLPPAEDETILDQIESKVRKLAATVDCTE